jgi:hypothetical protein
MVSPENALLMYRAPFYRPHPAHSTGRPDAHALVVRTSKKDGSETGARSQLRRGGLTLSNVRDDASALHPPLWQAAIRAHITADTHQFFSFQADCFFSQESFTAATVAALSGVRLCLIRWRRGSPTLRRRHPKDDECNDGGKPERNGYDKR